MFSKITASTVLNRVVKRGFKSGMSLNWLIYLDIFVMNFFLLIFAPGKPRLSVLEGKAI